MTITIRLKTDNEAFADGMRDEELRRILREWLEEGCFSRTLRDSNGNTVGSVTITGR